MATVLIQFKRPQIKLFAKAKQNPSPLAPDTLSPHETQLTSHTPPFFLTSIVLHFNATETVEIEQSIFTL